MYERSESAIFDSTNDRGEPAASIRMNIILPRDIAEGSPCDPLPSTPSGSLFRTYSHSSSSVFIGSSEEILPLPRIKIKRKRSEEHPPYFHTTYWKKNLQKKKNDWRWNENLWIRAKIISSNCSKALNFKKTKKKENTLLPPQNLTFSLFVATAQILCFLKRKMNETFVNFKESRCKVLPLKRCKTRLISAKTRLPWTWGKDQQSKVLEKCLSSV